MGLRAEPPVDAGETRRQLSKGVSAGATEKVEKRVIIRNAGEGPLREPLSEEMRAKLAKCEGQPVEANAEAKGADGKLQRTRIVLCGKGDPKQVADRLEKAVTRIEGESEMSPDAKAKILAELRAKIAELRSR